MAMFLSFGSGVDQHLNLSLEGPLCLQLNRAGQIGIHYLSGSHWVENSIGLRLYSRHSSIVHLYGNFTMRYYPHFLDE